MVKFSLRDFKKISISKEEINQYISNAERDINIAEQSDIPVVKFDFSYKALIKIGIALIAHHGYQVSSKRGHHIKILLKLSEILEDDSIETIGNVIRGKRNQDFYGGGIIVTEKEAEEYYEFIKNIIDLGKLKYM